MMPKRFQIHRLFNNSELDDNVNHSNLYGHFRNGDNLSLDVDGPFKSNTPIVLKRNPLIKYEDSIPSADISDDTNRRNKDIHDDKNGKNEKPPFCTLFKTGSISSLKISSLKEQWPSSEFVTSGRCKVRTQSTCDEHRTRLPTKVSNGTIADYPQSFTVPRSTGSVSSQGDLQNLSLSSDKSLLSSCLSKCDSHSKSAASQLMQLMDFTDVSLVESLQNFIRKIPVIGESQERDRILTYFTNRFMECNSGAFKNNDPTIMGDRRGEHLLSLDFANIFTLLQFTYLPTHCCHTLVCAVMLLNTDIHGQVSKKRMTCKEFVDNILANYPNNDYKENDLICVYNFIKKTELRNEETAEISNTLRRKFSKLITKSIKPAPEVNQINIDPNLLNQQHFISGNIMRKCVKKSFGKKPALGHRGWKLQFASLIGLQLLLFKTNLNKNDGITDPDDINGDRISLTDSNISSELLQNDDSSLCLSINNAAKSINSKLASSCSRDNIQVSVDDVESCIKIHHALASVVEKLRHKNVFSLRLADQAEYFFKVKSDQLHTWVNSINSAAAILSASPIIGAGQCGIYKPLLPGYLTDLDKSKQMESHEEQIKHYKESLKKLQLVNSKTRAINEHSIQFCRYEIYRFEVYLKLLRSQSIDELSSIDTDTVLSIMESNNAATSTTPRSDCHTSSHNPIEPSSSHNLTTLRRRPPKVPSSLSKPVLSSREQPSAAPTTISSSSQAHIPVTARPVTYSPQIGSHFTFTRSAGLRPTPSFSRFIEPSFVTSYQPVPTILSPLITVRSQHVYQVVPPPPTSQLPEYSPPSSRHNINKV